MLRVSRRESRTRGFPGLRGSATQGRIRRAGQNPHGKPECPSFSSCSGNMQMETSVREPGGELRALGLLARAGRRMPSCRMERGVPALPMWNTHFGDETPGARGGSKGSWWPKLQSLCVSGDDLQQLITLVESCFLKEHNRDSNSLNPPYKDLVKQMRLCRPKCFWGLARTYLPPALGSSVSGAFSHKLGASYSLPTW